MHDNSPSQVTPADRFTNSNFTQILDPLLYLLRSKQLFSFATRAQASETLTLLREGKAKLPSSDEDSLDKVVSALNSDEIREAIMADKITLAMIKPKCHMGKDLPSTDEEASNFLIEEIGKDKVLLKLNYHFSKEDAELFYQPEREKYEKIYEGGESIWDRIINFATSNPLTVLILTREEGGAIQWWRDRMGKTRPSEASADSIRGRYALQENLPNNLCHGSDSVASVMREVGCLSLFIQNCIKSSQASTQIFPSEEVLKSIGILQPNEQLQAMYLLKDIKTGESWSFVYKLSIADETDIQITRFIREKNIISFAGDLQNKATEQFSRLSTLSAAGVLTPHLYGCHGGAVYTEYIPNDRLSPVVDKLKRGILDDESNAVLIQLVAIAQALDRLHFAASDFVGDLVFETSDSKLYYVDAGSDLGSQQNSAIRSNLSRLHRTFYKLTNDINLYSK